MGFAHKIHKNYIKFIELKFKLLKCKLDNELYVRPTYCHQYFHYLSFFISNAPSALLFIAKNYASEAYDI